MSQLSSPGGVSTLTGNTGGVVRSDYSGNISILGSNVISIAGTPASNQLSVSLNNGTDGQLLVGGGALPIWANLTSAGGTVLINNGPNSINLEASGSVPIRFDSDAGSAIPVLGVLNISGGTNINTAGAGLTVTANLDSDITSISSITMDGSGSVRTGTTSGNAVLLQAYDVTAVGYETFATLTADAATPTMDISDSVTKSGGYIYRAGGTDVSVSDGGTGASALTDHGVLVGSGTGAVTPLAVGTNGQVVLGSTGADPVFATLASSGSTIAYTTGAGTLNLETGSAVAVSAPTDSGTATPAAGALTFAGGTNISTSGAGSTVTINFSGPLTVANGGTGAATLTDHGVLLGSGTAAISPTIGTDGQVLVGGTAVDPAFATITSIDGTLDIVGGSTTLDLDLSANTQATAIDSWNGSTIEVIETTIASSGTVITVSIQKSGGGNITVVFSDGYYTWVTAPTTIALTAGTDTSPQINYIYLLKSTKVLTVSTTGFPVGIEHLRIATAICQSALSLQADGPYQFYAYQTGVVNPNDSGHTVLVNAWIRAQNATWSSGVTPSLNITANPAAPDNVIFTSNSGVVLQLKGNVFPAFTGTPDLYVVNDSVTPYNKITDLNALLSDSTGASMSAKYFSLVVWGVVSDDGNSKLVVNLPGGSYGTAAGIDLDEQRYADYSIPKNFVGTGFLISELKFRHQTSSSGTWTLVESVDLRGLVPSLTPGGTTAAAAEFPDNLFRVYGDVDDTKKIAFEVNGMTTGTTRTITMADNDVDLSNVPTSLPVIVGEGGIGTTTLTDHSVLLGSGTAAITPTAVGTDGQVLVGGTGVDPAFATISSADGTIYIAGGSTALDLDLSTNTVATAVHSWNGSTVESASQTVTSDGISITFSTEKAGGGDLTAIFSDGYYAWDTTPAATVPLTGGTDSSPVINYIYLLQSTKALTVSTSSWPVTECAKLATVICQSAASLQADGPYKFHGWHDHATGSNNSGHIGHLNSWIRAQNATWLSGVSQTLTITPQGAAPDNVIFTSTTGIVYQLHENDFQAFTGTPDLYTINDSVTAYNKVTDLNALLTDSTGASMSAKYFSLVIWGTVNEDDSKLMVNLPGGSYGTAAGINLDELSYADYSIPRDFKGTGFLISELKFRHQTSSSGTWTLIDNIDLRGLVPSLSPGGTTATPTEFADNTFRIYDDGDDTKEIAFEASSITAGNTRTITMADGNVDLANVPTALPVIVGEGGIGTTTLTDHGVLVGSGTGAITPLTVGTNGQVILGSTGADPVFATLASSGSTIAFTTGAGTLNLETGSAVTISAPTDSGTATPSSGALTFSGGTNIATSGTGAAVTINFDGTLPVSSGGTGLTTITDHGVLLGSGTGAVTPTAAGSSGQLLMGTTSADPVFSTPTSTGSTIAFTPGAGTLNFETGSAVAKSVVTGSGTATPSSGVLTLTGGTNIATTGTGSTATINFDGTLPVASGGSGRTTATAYGVLCGGTTTTAAHQSIASVGTSAQVLTSNGAGALPTFQDASSGGMSWEKKTTTPFTMTVSTGYIMDSAAQIVATLPATSVIGDVISIAGSNTGGWRVSQPAGYSIIFGTSTSSTGTSGYIQSTNGHDCIDMVCSTANSEWVVRSSIGNITVA